MKAKIISLCVIILFLSSYGFSQKGVVNNGAKIAISTGAYLNIDGATDADYTNKTSNTLDGRIDLNGTIQLEGDWINNASGGNVLINVNTDGTVQFDGSSTHSIEGTSTNYFAFEKLTVESGSTLEIAEDKDVTLSGDLSNNGNFTIKSTATGSASFIDNGTISGSGTENAQIYLTGSNNGSIPTGTWWYLSPATSDATSSFIHDACTYYKLYYWNETASGTHGWNQIANNSTALTSVKGYAAKTDNNKTLSFSGSLNTGPESIGLTRTVGQTKEGFNLVGNPYPSAIDWEAASGWTKTNVENNTLWFRSNGTFPTYNGNSHQGTLSGTQYIPAMQGFWVRVDDTHTTGTLGMNNNVRVHNSQTFWKENKSFPKIRLKVSRETFIDDAVVIFIGEATNEFDMYDTEKMFASNDLYPQIYFTVPVDHNLAVNALPELSHDLVIPLGFKTSIEGQFVITASEFEDILPTTKIYLEDLQEDIITDLRSTNEYVFSSVEAYNTDRFVIHFLPKHTVTDDLTGDNGDGTATATDIATQQEISLYSYESAVYVKCTNPEELNAQLSIVNMLGQELYHKNLSKTSLNKISFDGNYSNYLVRIISNDNIVTKTLFIK